MTPANHSTLCMGGLVGFGLLCFGMWTYVFAWLADIDIMIHDASNDMDRHTCGSTSYLIDLWLAFALPHAVDAVCIVFNFNRTSIHQWHYWVSLRMLTMSSVFTYGYYLFCGGSSMISIIVQCVMIMMSVIYSTRILHDMLPQRGTVVGFGSLKSFTANMNSTRMSWITAIICAATNGAMGALAVLWIPTQFATLIPMWHIIGEMCVLATVRSKQTPEYIIFATPVVQAVPAIYWGLNFVSGSAYMTMNPAVFVGIMILSRALLDFSFWISPPTYESLSVKAAPPVQFANLHTAMISSASSSSSTTTATAPTAAGCTAPLIRCVDSQSSREAPLIWLHKNVVLSVIGHAKIYGCMLLLEYIGIPFLSMYWKLTCVFGMHAAGVLVFLMPAAYCIMNPLQQTTCTNNQSQVSSPALTSAKGITTTTSPIIKHRLSIQPQQPEFTGPSPHSSPHSGAA